MESIVINSIAQMAHSTIALIFAAILGVSGMIEDVQFHGGTMIVVPRGERWGLALGGIVFTTEANDPFWGPKIIAHERGHLAQEQLLGALYLPIVGIPSVIGKLSHTYAWPETWATELGRQ